MDIAAQIHQNTIASKTGAATTGINATAFCTLRAERDHSTDSRTHEELLKNCKKMRPLNRQRENSQVRRAAEAAAKLALHDEAKRTQLHQVIRQIMEGEYSKLPKQTPKHQQKNKPKIVRNPLSEIYGKSP